MSSNTATSSPHLQTPNPSARILVVGEVNPFGADPAFALFHLPRGSSGNRLREIMGLRDGTYLRCLDRVNLCSGRWGKKQAARSAGDVVSYVMSTRERPVLVLLGAKVRDAFAGILFARGTVFAFPGPPMPEPGPFFVAKMSDGVTVVFLPHPSGRCRVWNEEGSVGWAREALKIAAPEVPWGEVDR